MNMKIDRLVKLAHSADSIVDFWSIVGNRQAAAKDPQTPVTILEQLAEDPIFIVRREVANNPNTPAAALAKLIEDPEDEWGYLVREVAAHPHASTAILLQVIGLNVIETVRYGTISMPLSLITEIHQ
jgi:hypothetical protein